MSRFLKFLGVGLLVSLMTPVCWAANALIVHDGTPGIEADALGNLNTHLVAAAFTVTQNVGVPGGSLATYEQIWDIRFNNTTPLTPSDITAYTTYLNAGGRLFVMGENAGFNTRNTTVVSLISAAGGGNITLVTPQNTETVNPPFTGPTPLTTITFLAADGAAFPPGTGNPITRDPLFIAAAVVWSPGTLVGNPTGALIAVFDVNFLQAGADANSQALTDNMIAYLAAPTAVVQAPEIPALSYLGLALLAALLAVVAIRVLR